MDTHKAVRMLWDNQACSKDSSLAKSISIHLLEQQSKAFEVFKRLKCSWFSLISRGLSNPVFDLYKSKF